MTFPYRYGMLLRPLGITHPKGYDLVERGTRGAYPNRMDLPPGVYPWGAIRYNEPLTHEQVENHDLCVHLNDQASGQFVSDIGPVCKCGFTLWGYWCDRGDENGPCALRVDGSNALALGTWVRATCASCAWEESFFRATGVACHVSAVRAVHMLLTELPRVAP